MNNEEMFQTILNRMDSMETSLNGRMDSMESSLNGRMDDLESSLNGRMDNLEDRMNKLEYKMELEFYAVRTEMDGVYKSAQEQFGVLNSKFDKLMYTKDVEGYDKINIRLEVVERAYQELKEKIS